MSEPETTTTGAAAAREEDVTVTYTEVEALQDHGISVADITKLKVAGIATVESVQSTTKNNLAKFVIVAHDPSSCFLLADTRMNADYMLLFLLISQDQRILVRQ